MVIGVCGFGYSGSGAVEDLLKEYSCVKSLSSDDIEFSIIYRPDGLCDLKYHVDNPCRYFSSDVAIERFRKRIHSFLKAHSSVFTSSTIRNVELITDEYIHSISDVIWKGWWSYDIDNMEGLALLMYKVLTKITTAISPRLNIKLQQKCYYRDMHISVKPTDFLEKTKKYLVQVFDAIGIDIQHDIVVVNQCFSADNPSLGTLFFDNPKVIVVDKDPRDLYLLMKKESFVGCSWTPTDTVDDFIKFYERMRRGYEDIDKERVLLVKIENMIYEYDKTIRTIEEYLEIPSSFHVSPRLYFDPTKSINNTQLFIKHHEMKEDIDKITSQLKDYLFSFEDYPVMNNFGKTF